MADIESTLLGHLEFLYGARAAAVLDDLMQLMRSFAGRIGGGSDGRLSERDAVVITYGDMVSEPGLHPLASLGEFLADRVSDVVSTVHILPFYPYSSDDGFSVIDYLEVDPELGNWDNVTQMGETFRLMFDAVLNHVSAESEWFKGFRDGDERFADYFTVVAPDADTTSVFRPRELPLLTEVDAASGPKRVWTTFSSDQIDLNYRNPAVLLAAVEVLLTYVARGADVIRLDAVAFIWKELGTSCIHLPQTHRLIQLFRSVIDEVAPGVRIITETNVPHDENVSYFGDGTNEAHMVYNFALPPLTLQAFQTGDARTLTNWARGLSSPAGSTTFFNFLASHDGIGVGGARGFLSEEAIDRMAERTEALGGKVSYRIAADGTRRVYELNINFLDALGDPAGSELGDELTVRRFVTSQAMMLALQGVPAIYFHSLVGSKGWAAGVEQSGSRRTINREKLARVQLESKLDDPGSMRHRVFRGYRRLLEQRSSHAAFSPAAAQRVVSLGDALFVVLRVSQSSQGFVLCVHNVTPSAHRLSIDLEQLSVPETSGMKDLFGGGVVRSEDGKLPLEIEPYQTIWIAGEGTQA
jgi:sucrose phosphorylase